MLTSNNKNLNYQFVSVNANQYQERYYFPDLPNLRNVLTHRIVAYHNGIFTNDINNQALCTPSVVSSSYLTINQNGIEVIQKLDLTSIVSVTSRNALVNENGTLELMPIKIDFSKSYISLSLGFQSITYPFVYAFGIYYAK